MKSSVTDVTDPAKLSKLAGSTAEKLPVCELTSLTFACLQDGFSLLFLEQTHSKGPSKAVGGRMSVAGGAGITKPPWSSLPSMKLLVHTSGSPQSALHSSPDPANIWAPTEFTALWGVWDQQFNHTTLHF